MRVDPVSEDNNSGGKRAKRARRRLRRFLIASSVIGVAAASFPEIWGPPLLSWAVPAVARRAAGVDVTLPVEHASINRITIRGAEIRNVPGAPKIAFAEIRCSLAGLFGKRIDSVAVDGVALDAASLTNSMPRRSGRRASAPALPPDPLCGWSVGDLSVGIAETDLSPAVPPGVAALVTNTTLSAELRARGTHEGMEGDLRVRALGHQVTASLSYARAANGAEAHADFALAGSRLNAAATFLSGADGWSVDAVLPRTRVSHDDPFIAAPLGRVEIPNVEDIAFSGDVSATFSAELFSGDPVPSWKAGVVADGFDAALSVYGKPVRVHGFRTTGGVDGVGTHFDIRPMFPRFATASFDGFHATNGWASLRATETALLATEAHVGICGGDVHLYSLFLSPEKLDAGFTLFVDDIDAGEFLACLPGFRGSATGRLHGRIPLFVKRGREVRFGKAFLYSTPGETGRLRIDDASPVTDSLATAGASQDMCENLAKALVNLHYDALRFNLNGGEDGCLSVSVHGRSGEGPAAVPVDMTVNFRGALERLLNFGLRARGTH